MLLQKSIEYCRWAESGQKASGRAPRRPFEPPTTPTQTLLQQTTFRKKQNMENDATSPYVSAFSSAVVDGASTARALLLHRPPPPSLT